MFLKKHQKQEWSQADLERQRLLCDYFKAENQLEKQVEEVIVRKGVIDLYPDGLDKDLAVKDFEAAQRSLISAICAMDSRRNEEKSFIEDHEKDFVVTAQWEVPSLNISSHAVIERVYRDFFKL